jgi:hypothetical protein
LIDGRLVVGCAAVSGPVEDDVSGDVVDGGALDAPLLLGASIVAELVSSITFVLPVRRVVTRPACLVW